ATRCQNVAALDHQASQRILIEGGDGTGWSEDRRHLGFRRIFVGTQVKRKLLADALVKRLVYLSLPGPVDFVLGRRNQRGEGLRQRLQQQWPERLLLFRAKPGEQLLVNQPQG